MLSWLKTKRIEDPVMRLLSWRGEPVSGADLRTLEAARKTLGTKLRRLDANLGKAALSERIERATIRKPARCVLSYRADMHCHENAVTSLVGAAGGVRLGQDMHLYHDCALQEITIHQLPSQKKTVGAPFRMALDILEFKGRYVSFSLELPKDKFASLGRDEVIKIVLTARSENPMAAVVRMNFECGPEVKSQESHAELAGKSVELSFDPTELELSGIGKIWVDILLNAPRYQRVVFDDIVAHRCLKPEI